MAETDTRLETLEDEVKVLKGEVKRTLVDLRALLMREDSPLGEGAAAKRMAMQNAGPGNGASPTAAPAAGPGPGPPPPAMPYPEALAPPGAPPADNSVAVAQQERKLAEQERRLADHDRKIADFENEDGPALPKKPRRPARAGPYDSGEAADDPEDVVAEDVPDYELEEEGPVMDARPPGRQVRSNLSRVDLKGGLKKKPQLDQVSGEAEMPGENKSDSRGKSEPVTSIYDEYRELLEETKQTHAIEDEPVGPPLDVNLMVNLVYWASLAKQRVGEAQLKDILQLYIQSGHSRPELQDLLLQICKMVDVESAVIEEKGSDWVDLLFHLHGILTGGFPVMKIPYVRLPAQEEAQGSGK